MYAFEIDVRDAKGNWQIALLGESRAVFDQFLGESLL